MKCIGLDPGKLGFLVELDSELKRARTMQLPFRPDGILCLRTIQKYFDLQSANAIIMEKISPQPVWSAISCMTFGRIIGQLEALFAPYPFQQISPKIWQKMMHVGLSGDLKPKQKSLAIFHRLNPDYPPQKKIVDHNLADAYLLAEYGLRSNNIMITGWKFEHIDNK